MRLVFFALLLLCSNLAAAGTIMTMNKIPNPSIKVTSIDGATTYYQENNVKMPWRSVGMDWAAIPSSDRILVTMYNNSGGFHSSNVQADTLTIGDGLVIYFQGETPVNHFVSFPVVMGATVFLRDPDTMRVIYQYKGSTTYGNGLWVIEPYVLDNFSGDLVLIDVSGGFYMHDKDSESPGVDNHLYALVKKESLYEGSVTTSFFTHLSYLALQKNKKKITKKEYNKFLEENNRTLTATSLKYSFSSSDKALYLRPKNIVVGHGDYFLTSKYFVDKRYVNSSISAFSALTRLSVEKQVSEVYTPTFRFKMLGWGYEIEDAKSTSLSIVTVSTTTEVSLKINGFPTLHDRSDVVDGLIIQSYLPRTLDEDPIVIEIKAPMGTSVEWFDCDRPAENFCYTGQERVHNVVAKISQPNISNNLSTDKPAINNNQSMWDKVRPGVTYDPTSPPIHLGGGRYYLPALSPKNTAIRIVDTNLSAYGGECPSGKITLTINGSSISACDKSSHEYEEDLVFERHVSDDFYFVTRRISVNSFIRTDGVYDFNIEGPEARFGIAHAQPYLQGSVGAEGAMSQRFFIEKRGFKKKGLDGKYGELWKNDFPMGVSESNLLDGITLSSGSRIGRYYASGIPVTYMFALDAGIEFGVGVHDGLGFGVNGKLGMKMETFLREDDLSNSWGGPETPDCARGFNGFMDINGYASINAVAGANEVELLNHSIYKGRKYINENDCPAMIGAYYQGGSIVQYDDVSYTFDPNNSAGSSLMSLSNFDIQPVLMKITIVNPDSETPFYIEASPAQPGDTPYSITRVVGASGDGYTMFPYNAYSTEVKIVSGKNPVSGYVFKESGDVYKESELKIETSPVDGFGLYSISSYETSKRLLLSQSERSFTPAAYSTEHEQVFVAQESEHVAKVFLPQIGDSRSRTFIAFSYEDKTDASKIEFDIKEIPGRNIEVRTPSQEFSLKGFDIYSVEGPVLIHPSEIKNNTWGVKVVTNSDRMFPLN